MLAFHWEAWGDFVTGLEQADNLQRVAKAGSHLAGRLDPWMVYWDKLLTSGDFLQRHGLDAVTTHGYHRSRLTLADELSASGAELRGENTVNG